VLFVLYLLRLKTTWITIYTVIDDKHVAPNEVEQGLKETFGWCMAFQ
jgi:hypothetical protein